MERLIGIPHRVGAPLHPNPDYLEPRYADLFGERGLVDFVAFWELERAWVEAPNHRRGGWSGVVKLSLDSPEGRRHFFVKRQERHSFRTARHGFRKRPTLAREFEALVRLRAGGVPVPEVAFFGRRGSRAVLVLPELTGFRSLKEWIRLWEKEGWPDRSTRRRIAEAVAAAIAALHRSSWCHRALHDKHVFLKLDPLGAEMPEVRLIDLERARSSFFRKRAIVKDLGPLYRRTPQLSPRDRLRFFNCYTALADIRFHRRSLMKAISADGFHPVESPAI